MAPIKIRLTQELSNWDDYVSHINFGEGSQEHYVTVERSTEENDAPSVLSFSTHLTEQDLEATLSRSPPDRKLVLSNSYSPSSKFRDSYSIETRCTYRSLGLGPSSKGG